MKERGILFSGAMVRALLAGVKTQTRRLVNPPPPRATDDVLFNEAEQGFVPWEQFGRHGWRRTGEPFRCPYGVPGDRLWVRERFVSGTMAGGRPWVRYFADEPNDIPDGTRWKPSIHMPRAFSRITLEVVRVRIERVQSISEADAQAEGAEPCFDTSLASFLDKTKPVASTHAIGFKRLWWEINGQESWEANPFVWVVDFRRLP